jgi:hypothetical protein
MKRTNAPPIPEGLRITLNGEQEWKDVMQVFEDAGWMWGSGSTPTETVKEYAEEDILPVVITENNKTLLRGSKYQSDTLTAAQFLQQYQGTIEYEIGDWVVVTEHILTTDWSRKQEAVGYIVQIPVDKETGGCIVTALNNGAEVPISPNKYRINYTAKNLRPATPEEIASVTQDKPVALGKPESYIWDGDVLPDEYYVENPWPGEDNTEFVEFFNSMRKRNGISGAHKWYHVKNSKRIDSHNYSNANTELPIVPYELWKQILTAPDNQAEQAAVKKRMFKEGDRVKVVRGAYEGCIGTVDNMAFTTDSLYWVNLDSGDRTAMFSGENGTGVDIVHYTEEPAVEKWFIVTTDGVRVYEGDIVWWLNPDGSWYGNENGNKVLHTDKENHKDHNKLLFSTFEAAEEYISKQKETANRKWKVSDKYCIPGDNSGGWYIREHSNNLYKVETAKGLTDWDYTAKEIDEYINSGHWVPDHRSWPKSSKEKDDNTTNNKTKNQTTNNGNNKQQPQQDSCISNIENSSSYGTSVNLRTDPETICPGERRTTAAVCLCGQPEYIVR